MTSEWSVRVKLVAAVLFGTGLAGCHGGAVRGTNEDARHRHRGDHGSHDRPGMHRRFADADTWAARFESTNRDEWQKPEHVLKVLNLAPDAKVADIGSATGYFPVRFARAVPRGQVYGLDIEPDMVRYLNERAARDGLTNLTSILAQPDDPKIPEPVDLIFVCNTYHHITDRVAYFRARLSELRPGGRLVIVDFKPGELPVGPSPEHKIPPEQIKSELEEAGYRLMAEDVGLLYQILHVYVPAEVN